MQPGATKCGIKEIKWDRSRLLNVKKMVRL